MLQTIHQLKFSRIYNSINSSNKHLTKYKDAKIKFYIKSDNRNLDPIGQITSLNKRDSCMNINWFIRELSDNFYLHFHIWVHEKDGLFIKWAQNIYENRDLTAEQSAKLIQRAHRRYVRKKLK